ncbi:MAG TPA: hypothetical protein VMB49_13340 [Acidobacteriaceae bacterium]|nr:hypothetical protein [Acidobacteriaceae bacterium]
MNGTPNGGAGRRPADAMRSNIWPDYNASLAIAQKTRRAVRDQVISTQEQRNRKLRTMGFALSGFLCLLILLGPAIWNGVEDLMAGDHILDFHTIVSMLILMLFPAMLAALIAAMWKGKKDLQHDRGGYETFRPIDK